MFVCVKERAYGCVAVHICVYVYLCVFVCVHIICVCIYAAFRMVGELGKSLTQANILILEICYKPPHAPEEVVIFYVCLPPLFSEFMHC